MNKIYKVLNTKDDAVQELLSTPVLPSDIPFKDAYICECKLPEYLRNKKHHIDRDNDVIVYWECESASDIHILTEEIQRAFTAVLNKYHYFGDPITVKLLAMDDNENNSEYEFTIP